MNSPLRWPAPLLSDVHALAAPPFSAARRARSPLGAVLAGLAAWFLLAVLVGVTFRAPGRTPSLDLTPRPPARLALHGQAV
ncbi:MAG: hypothetical protein U0228_10575 [Myxococcaceae bacterium]